MNRNLLLQFVFSLLLLGFSMSLLTLASCSSKDSRNKNDDGSNKIAQQYVYISGNVSADNPLEKVKVSAANQSTLSDVNGSYRLQVPLQTNDEIVITYEKDGYGTYQRRIPVNIGQTVAVDAKLLRYQMQENVDLSQAQMLTVPADAGGDLVSLDLAADSILVNSTVSVSIATGDPTTDSGRAVFPGDFMAAESTVENPDTPLESVAYTEITMVDAEGNELTTLDKPAMLTVRLPDSLQSQYAAGDTIEWWSYNETSASWVREDADPDDGENDIDNALIVDVGGILFAQAKVTHFSWWNVDRPVTQHTCLGTQVLDKDGNALANVRLIGEGVSYNGRSRPANTNTDGRAYVTVKRTTDVANPEQIKLFVEYGGVNFYYDISDAAEGDVTSDVLNTPTTQGSTLDNSGECVDLQNPIQIRFDGVIQGLVNDRDGKPKTNFELSNNLGASTTTDAQGMYSFEVPINVPVTIFAPWLVSETVSVTDATNPLTLNFNLQNRVPEISTIDRIPEGLIANNQSVTISVTANDGDNDALTYSWSSSGGGTLNTSSGNSVNWTAPASGVGTSSLTVTVDDAHGGTTSQTLNLVWGGGVTGTVLKLTLKNNPISDALVSGVMVVLYNSDGSIATEITTDASGVADFGDIGRTRADIAFFWENTSENLGTERAIRSFNQIPVGELVFYTAMDLSLSAGNQDVTGVDKRMQTCASKPVSLNFSNIPANTSYFVSFPDYQYVQSSGQSISVCDEASINMAAIARSSTGEVLAYGFIENEPLTGVDALTIDLSSSPSAITWSSNASSTYASLDVTSFWDNRITTLANLSSISDETSVAGLLTSMNFPVTIPVDQYWFTVSSYNTNTTLSSTKRYGSTPPSTMQFNLPDYEFIIADTPYDPNQKSMTWSYRGESPRDITSLAMSFYGSSPNTTNGVTTWQVQLPGNATKWTFPTLPSSKQDWVSFDYFNFTLGVHDLDFVSSVDELWASAALGSNIEQLVSRYDSGVMYGYAYDPNLGTPAKPVFKSLVEQRKALKPATQIIKPAASLFGGWRRR
ncbi:MAG: hypothetical protein OEY38_01220 [Gammaproteobacteria bacterium]|nr:hypothetical protein [Gammaproteobacteria bacterium]